jgi:hypothetical protein
MRPLHTRAGLDPARKGIFSHVTQHEIVRSVLSTHHGTKVQKLAELIPLERIRSSVRSETACTAFYALCSGTAFYALYSSAAFYALSNNCIRQELSPVQRNIINVVLPAVSVSVQLHSGASAYYADLYVEEGSFEISE